MDLIRILILLTFFIMVNQLSGKFFVLGRSFSMTSEIRTQLTLVSWGMTAESHEQVHL